MVARLGAVQLAGQPLYAIILDAAQRKVLGGAVSITQDAWDECNTVIRLAGPDGLNIGPVAYRRLTAANYHAGARYCRGRRSPVPVNRDFRSPPDLAVC
jgi:hypothetical protein